MITSLPISLRPFIWHFVKKQWPYFLIIQLFFCGWAIDHTVFPYVMQRMVDALSGFTGDKGEIWSYISPILWFGGLLWLGVEISYRVSWITAARTFPRMEAHIRMAMMDSVQGHSHTYFANHFAGSIANKISDISQGVTRIVQLLGSVFLPAFLALAIATVMFGFLHPVFAGLLGGWVILHIGTCLLCAKGCSYYSKVHSEARSDLSGVIVDSLTNNINVRLFSRRTFERLFIGTYQEDERYKNWQSLWFVEKMKILLGFLSLLGPGVAMTWFMIYSWQHEMITLGELIYIFNTTWNITIMVWISGMELPNFFREIGICRQALSLIQAPHDIVDAPDATALKVTKGTIEFDRVTFNYIRNNNIFKDKSVIIEPGSKTGLVGFSGSGKTTFVNLMLRYYDIESGRILIDGHDIAHVTQDSLREQIAMIPQDTSLFHRTLMENIRYGKLDATDEEVIEASKLAHCHEFITQIPEGYQSLVGERGVKLSGGQRQRIAIARAILKNAPILILDEATSALDSVTERHIQESLEYIMKDRTTIVVAHRLSTLAGMDRILVFDKGTIIENGTHQSLLAQKGHYAHLWQMQAGGFLPEREE